MFIIKRDWKSNDIFLGLYIHYTYLIGSGIGFIFVVKYTIGIDCMFRSSLAKCTLHKKRIILKETEREVFVNKNYDL